MSRLLIQPVEYRKDVTEMYETVKRAFYPLFNGFTVLDEVRATELPENVFEHQKKYVNALKFLEHFPQQREPLLVVTSLSLIDQDAVFRSDGYGLHDSRRAVISSYGVKPEELKPLVVHELGHVYGLDHIDHNRTSNDRPCPMNAFPYDSFTEAKADSIFCGFCYEKLGIPEPVIKTQ